MRRHFQGELARRELAANAYVVVDACPHPRGDGWTLRLDDGSVVFCPNDTCKATPEADEKCVLRYHGNTFRVASLTIGGRFYGGVE
jgi:hypothetical protein